MHAQINCYISELAKQKHKTEVAWNTLKCCQLSSPFRDHQVLANNLRKENKSYNFYIALGHLFCFTTDFGKFFGLNAIKVICAGNYSLCQWNK